MRGLRGVAVVRHSRQFSGSYRLSLARGTVTFRERIPLVPDPDVLPDTCPVQYYLDGMPYPLTSRGIDEIPVGTLEAVEVFRGSAEVPAEFNRTDAACGVVLMWTQKSG